MTIYGENNRAKFVFIVYVPEGLSGMAKAKANMHKPFVDAFLKVTRRERRGGVGDGEMGR
jgi:hypothetical protein